jgi:hypothetical protein
MSKEYINEITLQYLTNDISLTKVNEKNEKKDVKNKKFYKKRIQDLTKGLLNGDKNNEIPEDLYRVFNLYVKQCVYHFKQLDSSDILQEEYMNLESMNDIIQENNEETNRKIKIATMNTCNIKEKNALEKFIVRTKITDKKEEEYPKKKDLDLKNPLLKSKGIKKKNNIDYNYENEKKKE